MAVDWSQGIFLTMMLRDDLQADQVRTMLCDFLVPALATPE